MGLWGGPAPSRCNWPCLIHLAHSRAWPMRCKIHSLLALRKRKKKVRFSRAWLAWASTRVERLMKCQQEEKGEGEVVTLPDSRCKVPIRICATKQTQSLFGSAHFGSGNKHERLYHGAVLGRGSVSNTPLEVTGCHSF